MNRVFVLRSPPDLVGTNRIRPDRAKDPTRQIFHPPNPYNPPQSIGKSNHINTNNEKSQNPKNCKEAAAYTR
jgi:hypothetical protein